MTINTSEQVPIASSPCSPMREGMGEQLTPLISSWTFGSLVQLAVSGPHHVGI
jgi:hypothetical protein